MVRLTSTSRKDDIESLMYILCFLLNGTLPIIEFINLNIDNFHMSKFLNKVLQYRIEKREECHVRIKDMLPMSMRNAFQYTMQLNHEDKPDYNLIKLWMAFDDQDEQRAFESKLDTTNSKMAKNILFQDS